MGLLKIGLMVALASGAAFSQTIESKLKGKRIYLHRKDGGDHTDGFVGLRDLLEGRRTAYGYLFESSSGSPNEAALNTLFDRLYTGGPKMANTIDILILCQGQGDQNIGGGSNTTPFPGAPARFGKVNNHVRNGGGFVIVHAAAGREISRQGWWFGAKLMGDWFHDQYKSKLNVPGNNAGHFGYPTDGTFTLDDETLESKDPSTYFIRKLLTTAKAQGGMGQPLLSPNVGGEWYHFNAGKAFDDGTGGDISEAANKFRPEQVRGHIGAPDSGIGPTKITGVLTKIGGAVPIGGKQLGTWVREVSKGRFDPTKKLENGRFLYFSPGHAKEEFFNANGWMGDFFFANLRWVAKEDLGCTDNTKATYNPLATVNDGITCPTVALQSRPRSMAGKLSLGAESLEISLESVGHHTVKVIELGGKTIFEQVGAGNAVYRVPGLSSGSYIVLAGANGETHRRVITVR